MEFRPDGLLYRRYHKDPPPHPEWTCFYEYDNDSDRLIAERIEQDGKSTVVRKLEYDSTGRLVRVNVPDKDGFSRVAEAYSYNPDGKKHKVVHLEPIPARENCGVFIGVEGSEMGFGMPGVVSITCNYDELGRPAEHLAYDSSGERISRIDLLYDDRGNLIEETSIPQRLPPEIVAQCNAEQVAALTQFFIFGRRHRYDDHNRRIETSGRRVANDHDNTTFAYNDHGDVVLEISEALNSEYTLAEDGSLVTAPESARGRHSETLTRYKYDNHGNWIEKIVTAPDGQIWCTEHRTIHYFDTPVASV